MKAGFARIDITPPVGVNLTGYFFPRISDGVYTPLNATALAISDDKETILVLAVDNIGIVKEDVDILKDMLFARYQIAKDAIFLTCSHTHTGPHISFSNHDRLVNYPEPNADYIKEFREKICQVVGQALADMLPAQASVAREEAPGVSFVRRYLMNDGSIKTNPDAEDLEQIRDRAGKADDTVQLVKLTREGASDIAIIQFATHADNIGGTKISADWPSFLSQAVERALCYEADGKGVQAICVVGPQGDVGCSERVNMKTRTFVPRVAGVGKLRLVAYKLAGAVLKIYSETKPIESNGVFYKVCYVPAFVNRGDAGDVALAKRVVALNREKPGIYSEIDGMRFTTACRILNTETMGDTVDLNLSCVGFGEIAFVGFPGEVFSWVGSQTKEHSPFAMTLPCCITNGYYGYFPTKDAFGSGYEGSTTNFREGTAETLAEAAIALIQELK